MKLNLLPKTVGAEVKTRNAILFGIPVIIASVIGAVLMIQSSQDRLANAKRLVDEAKPGADKVVTVAKSADDAMANPAVKAVVVSSQLAKSMLDHNAVYPKLYNDLKPYIPAFFRINSLSATPIDDKTCTVTMQGVVKDFQQYADLMLALMRIPKATSVGRAGFEQEEIVVPALTASDQNGRPRKLSEGPIPDDALERLAYFEAQQIPAGYSGEGNFGTAEENAVRGAMPNRSLITVTITMERNIMTPNPRATLSSVGAAAAPGAPAAGGLGMGAPIGGGGIPPTPAGGAGASQGDDR